MLFVGCGKKAAPQPQAEAAPTAPILAPPPDAVVQASLDDIQKKIQAQQYESAVGALVAVNAMPKSDKQRNEYSKQLREANDALLQKAAQGDAEARQTQLILGRMLKGR
jgi:hypothetical protein